MLFQLRVHQVVLPDVTDLLLTIHASEVTALWNASQVAVRHQTFAAILSVAIADVHRMRYQVSACVYVYRIMHASSHTQVVLPAFSEQLLVNHASEVAVLWKASRDAMSVVHPSFTDRLSAAYTAAQTTSPPSCTNNADDPSTVAAPEDPTNRKRPRDQAVAYRWLAFQMFPVGHHRDQQRHA